MYLILLVADEEVARSLERELAEKLESGQAALDTEFFTSAAEALKRAAKKEFDLAIALCQLPDTDGMGFLKAFHEIQPAAARLLLARQAEREKIQAAKEMLPYRTVSHPWQGDELETAVAEALLQHNAELARRNLCQENSRLAAAVCEPVSAEHHSAYPGVYRTMIVSNDEGILTAAWRELVHHSTHETLYHALRQKALRNSEADWEKLKFVVDSFATPQEALEHAKKTPLDLVVADYAMAQMDGIAFFYELQKTQPAAARILLSARDRINGLLGPAMAQKISHIVGKPWHEYELKIAIAQALAYRDLLLEHERLSGKVCLTEVCAMRAK